MIYAAEDSNKFQKSKIWKEKSLEDVVTHGPTAQATLVYIHWVSGEKMKMKTN